MMPGGRRAHDRSDYSTNRALKGRQVPFRFPVTENKEEVMIRIRLAKATGCFLFTIAAMQIYVRQTQASANGQAAPSLQEFFQGLVQHYNPNSLPKYEDVLKVVDPIAGARHEDIANALPSLFVALAYPDDEVKIDAAFALTVISRRPDSAELLKSDIKNISTLFDSSDSRLQATPTLVFLNLKPAPLPEVLPPLLAFLERIDGDPQAQGSAVFTLVRLAPENPEVIAAIQEFLSRPLDSTTKIGVLNALGNPGMKDTRIVSVVIDSLDDPDEGVRSTAIQALMRMSQDALRQAAPALRRLVADQKQPARVIAVAKEALQRLRSPNNGNP